MKVIVITTGGTIAKTYDEWAESLRNDRPVVESIVAQLRLPDLSVHYRHILSKDSLDFTEADRQLILDSVRVSLGDADAILVVHGTGALTTTGELLSQKLGDVPVPIVLTGAMRPFEFRDSDAAQNMTEALLACRLVDPGIYVAMHNRVLRFPGVVKDSNGLSFEKQVVPVGE